MSLRSTSWRVDGLPEKGAGYQAAELQYIYTVTGKLLYLGLLTIAAPEDKGVGGNIAKRKRLTVNISIQHTGKLLSDMQKFAIIFSINSTWL